MNFIFDLQLFGGKGGSTTTIQPASVPAPTPEETEMQRLQLQYARPTAANALKLQDMASNMIFDNPGVSVIDYNRLGQEGANRSYDLQKQSDSLIRGELPKAYTDNLKQQVGEGMQLGLGNALNSASMRNVINSSTMESANRDIAEQGARQLREGFNQGLATQSNLLEQNRGLTSMPMEMLNAAQNAQIDIPGKLYALSTGQQAPTTETWKTMSNQRYTMASPQQAIVQQQPSGGVFGSLVGGLSQGWACFEEGTLISMEFGFEEIENIVVGNFVKTIDGLSEVIKVYAPTLAEIVIVRDIDKNELRTTAKQRIVVDKKLIRVEDLPFECDNYSIEYTGEYKMVYDFDVADKNLFYADGFLVEGMNENWE